jgi:hypothetical protein
MGQSRNNSVASNEIRGAIRIADKRSTTPGHPDETEFLLGDRELGGPGGGTRVRGRARLEFVTLSPFPHCVLPEHFFERFLHAPK